MMRQYHEVRKAKVAKNEAPPWWRQPRREKLEISTEEVDGWLAEGRDGEIVARRDALVLKHEATEQRKRAGALRDKRQRLKGWLLNKLVKFNPRQDVWNDALAKVTRTWVLRRSIARAAAGTVGGCADRRRGARAGRGRWRAQSRRSERIHPSAIVVVGVSPRSSLLLTTVVYSTRDLVCSTRDDVDL